MDVFQKFQFQGDLRRFQTELQTNYLFDILYTFEFFFTNIYIYLESNSSWNLMKRTLHVIKKQFKFKYVENSNSNFIRKKI